jgi:glycine cleavage system H protein
MSASEVPGELLYDIELDLWVRFEGSTAVVGITAFGAQQAGEFLIFTPKRAGWRAARGKALGLVETGKSVFAVKAPVSGEILEINDMVERRPTLINRDPYGAGWLFKLRALAAERETASLADADAYRRHCQAMQKAAAKP